MRLFGLIIEKAATQEQRNTRHQQLLAQLDKAVDQQTQLTRHARRLLEKEQIAHEETRNRGRHFTRALGRLMEICREIRTAKWAADAAPGTIDELVKSDPIYLEIGNEYALIRAGITALADDASWVTPPTFDGKPMAHLWLWAPRSHWIERSPAWLANNALKYLPDPVAPSHRSMGVPRELIERTEPKEAR